MASERGIARRLPSVDEVLRTGAAAEAIGTFGRPAVVTAVRDAIADARRAGTGAAAEAVADSARWRLQARAVPSLRPVLNLTGTVLHTSLGRALLAEAAIEAAARWSTSRASAPSTSRRWPKRWRRAPTS